MAIKFDNQVAIVTGAGNGLGKSHALDLARRGAKVVVNDLGAARDGAGSSSDAALEVVAQIEQEGGVAIANGADVSNEEQVAEMVKAAMNAWGRVDVLINNAGILRDKSFAKMSMDDFRLVLNVHLMGSAICSKAVWPIMREQAYGRILMTTSSSGLYGNFGQSNYGAAKLGVIGLMNTLHLEGAKYNIKVNSLAPVAATRMTEDLMPPAILELLKPEMVTPAAIYLCGEDAPSRTILCAGAGGFARARIFESDGEVFFDENINAENVAKNWDQIGETSEQRELQMGGQQSEKFLTKVATKLGLKLS